MEIRKAGKDARFPEFLAYNLDILSQLPPRFFAAKPRGRLSSRLIFSSDKSTVPSAGSKQRPSGRGGVKKRNRTGNRIAFAGVLAGTALLSLSLCPRLPAATPARRFGSGPLTRSVQNEADAAIARAQSWLIEQQAADGTWGGQNPYLTAVCALAVSGDGTTAPERHEKAIVKAVHWLATHPATNACTVKNLQAAAWRDLALQVLGAPSAPVRSPLLDAPLSSASNVLTELAILEARQMCGEPLPTNAIPSVANPAESLIRAAQGQQPQQVVRERVAGVAAAWGSPDVLLWREEQAQRAWWLARTINRQANGVLALSPTLTLDWRRDLADYWVSRQRITPHGGGRWDSAFVSPVEETAFAILLLREL